MLPGFLADGDDGEDDDDDDDDDDDSCSLRGGGCLEIWPGKWAARCGRRRLTQSRRPPCVVQSDRSGWSVRCGSVRQKHSWWKLCGEQSCSKGFRACTSPSTAGACPPSVEEEDEDEDDEDDDESAAESVPSSSACMSWKQA